MRARAAQGQHQALLNKLNAQTRKAVRDELIAVRRAYFDAEMREFGFGSVDQFSRTNPAQAIVLAVRDDMSDTERRIDLAISSGALQARIKAMIGYNPPSAPGAGLFRQVAAGTMGYLGFSTSGGSIGNRITIGAVGMVVGWFFGGWLSEKVEALSW